MMSSLIEMCIFYVEGVVSMDSIMGSWGTPGLPDEKTGIERVCQEGNLCITNFSGMRMSTNILPASAWEGEKSGMWSCGYMIQ